MNQAVLRHGVYLARVHDITLSVQRQTQQVLDSPVFKNKLVPLPCGYQLQLLHVAISGHRSAQAAILSMRKTTSW
jgi:hypothetical protein